MDSKQIIAIAIILLISGLLGYGMYKRNGSKVAPTSDIDSDTGDTKTSKSTITWIIVVIIAIVCIVIAYFYINRKKTDLGSFVAEAMKPDEFDAIHKQRMILLQGVPGYYDEDGNLQFAPNTVRETEVRPWVPTGTSHDFLAKTYEIINPDIENVSQLQTIMVNLNKDKKMIAAGLYAKHEHIGFFGWLRDKSYLRKLPPSTPESENLQMIQYATDNELDLGQLRQINQMKRPTQFEDDPRRMRHPQQDDEMQDEETPDETNVQRPWYRR